MTLEHLILLRHGETDWNKNQRLQGHRDIPLNAVGHHQAIDAAPSIVALRPSVDGVVGSAARPRDRLGGSVLTGIEATVDERLRETSMGLWEGLTRDEVIASWPGSGTGGAPRRRMPRRRRGSPAGRWRTGPTRWSTELDAGTASRALIVSHGGLIVGLTGRLLALPEDSWGTLIGVSNCHWVVLHRFAGVWRLHSYNAGLGGVVLPRGEDEVAGTVAGSSAAGDEPAAVNH